MKKITVSSIEPSKMHFKFHSLSPVYNTAANTLVKLSCSEKKERSQIKISVKFCYKHIWHTFSTKVAQDAHVPQHDLDLIICLYWSCALTGHTMMVAKLRGRRVAITVVNNGTVTGASYQRQHRPCPGELIVPSAQVNWWPLRFNPSGVFRHLDNMKAQWSSLTLVSTFVFVGHLDISVHTCS